MHESDQASFLRGAERLSSGKDSPWAASFYNYDKQFGAYWIVAAVRWAAPGADLVLLGNVVSFAIFWGGLAVLLVVRPCRSWLQVAAVASCFLAPAYLIHTPFLASAFMANGFLFLAAACWGGGRFRLSRRMGSLVALALATACRADALLVLPLFAWLVIPVSGPMGWLRRKWVYAIAFSGIVVVVLGRWVYSGDPIDLHPPFFYPKIFAAFFVFGMGAAALVSALLGARLLGVAIRRMRRGPRLAIFYAGGLVALFVPMGYYSVQLFSPRYWAVFLAGMILFLASRRGERLLRSIAGRWQLPMAIALMIASLAPVWVGVRLPDMRHPALTSNSPTLFPSADGWIPMGAFASHLARTRSGAEGGVDHNQATWLAAMSADYGEGSGAVPVLQTPLQTYLELAIELKGRTWRQSRDGDPTMMTDLRQLLRENNAFTGLADQDVGALRSVYGIEVVSDVVDGYCIVRLERGAATSPEVERLFGLSRLFGGNEFELIDGGGEISERLGGPEWAGKSVVLYGPVAFTVETTGPDGIPRSVTAKKDADIGYGLVLTGADRLEASFSVAGSLPRAAVARLPDYMRVQGL